MEQSEPEEVDASQRSHRTLPAIFYAALQLAYVAAIAAGIGRTDIVLEPQRRGAAYWRQALAPS